MSKPSISGIIAAAIIIISAFLPWVSVHVNGQHLVFTGLQTEGSTFGEPGKLNIVLSVMAAILFLVPKAWSPRVNLFVSGSLAAWTFRNMILFSRCEMGICPEQKIGVWLSLIGSLVLFGCVIWHWRSLTNK